VTRKDVPAQLVAIDRVGERSLKHVAATGRVDASSLDCLVDKLLHFAWRAHLSDVRLRHIQNERRIGRAAEPLPMLYVFRVGEALNFKFRRLIDLLLERFSEGPVACCERIGHRG
jgi:hypothetical protein